MGSTAATWLSVVALLLAILALVVSGVSLARTSRRRFAGGSRRVRAPRPRERATLSSDDVSAEIYALRSDVSTSLRHLAVVRYDAFGDMGGHLSWSMALLDDGGDGVVLTSIHGRSDSRTYAKNVSGWSANQQLTPEEQEAIGFARSGA